MRATAIFAAAALAFGTAALAQQADKTSRTENSASADTIRPADDAQRTKSAVKNLGQKTRNAMHRAGDKIRHVAKNDKHPDKHARAERHHRDDTRAMGAPGRDTRDNDMTRRQRMDAAYENWKSRQKNG
ncbi:hypothetical protein [Ramlibacter sp. PS4R-6]|uniref:hypothetical protein n=1 Tax=Ramlibacter sp. PS4R-6 TaxID=3133438 RepID=UPI003098E1E0